MDKRIFTIMGSEGHMLDMIKKLELNRTQRKDAGTGRLKSYKKQRLTEEYLQNIKNFEIEKPEEILPRKKRLYQLIAIVGLIVVVIGIILILILILSTPISFYGRQFPYID